MPSAAGVSWDDTGTGKLEESSIPDDDFESHYMYDGDTKDDSSYPVVDGSGSLRRGNVKSAWKLGGQGAPVSDDEHKSRVKELASNFDDPPVPEDATLQVEEVLTFSATTGSDAEIDFAGFEERVGDGFNEYGVRKNHGENDELQSVDVLYEAMEPGPPERRNGVRITEDFLQNVTSKDYSQPPFLRDHERKNSFAKIGDIHEVWFSENIGKIMLMNRIPNTGSPTHDEAIARFTHSPPSIRDGSLGFGQQYEAIRNDNGEPELVDGTIKEFSITNFPGGYDDGGIRTAFAEEAVEQAEIEFDDGEDEQEMPENSATFDIETITF